MTINKETHEPFADILLAKEAEVSETPMSFCYRYEEMDEVDHFDILPNIFIIDNGLLNHALKEGSSYVILTIAYIKVVSVRTEHYSSVIRNYKN